MRAGVVCAGAVAIAAAGTAILIRTDVIGGSKPGPSQVVAALTETPARNGVRQIEMSPPAAEPAPAAHSPAPPIPAPVIAATPPAAPIETTGSLNPNQATLYVSGSRVALRSAPAKDAKIVDRMNAGHKLTEVGREGDWVKVRNASGSVEGWVSAALVGPSPKTQR